MNNTKPDILILIANIMIFIGFLPSILSGDKPNVWTSFINVAATFFCFIPAYLMMGLRKAIVINVFIGMFWTVLMVQMMFR
jgi:hypothetical protein